MGRVASLEWRRSRDRYIAQIMACEDRLAALGFGGNYLRAILEKTGPRMGYLAALRRTITFKEKSRS